jgi:hypothetical protein
VKREMLVTIVRIVMPGRDILLQCLPVRCLLPQSHIASTHILSRIRLFDGTYLVEVDGGLPELLLGLVEVPHTDLTEVTGVVLVDVGTVVVLTTGHTTTTGALAVLADTTVTGGHMAAAGRES